jgi:cation diffusion facilitator family transporter
MFGLSENLKTSLISILVTCLITFLKFVGAFWSGSLALLTDAIHSVLDIFTNTMTFVSIKFSEKPADEDHHFGHTKIESLNAMFQAVLLIALSGYVFYEAFNRFKLGEFVIDLSPAVTLIVFLTVVIDLIRLIVVRNVAKRNNSQALEADALHFYADFLNGLFVLIGFGLYKLGFIYADVLIAVIVAIFILKSAFSLFYNTANVLTDSAPKGIKETILDILGNHKLVFAVEKVRVKSLGQNNFAEISIFVGRSLSFQKITDLKSELKSLLYNRIPNLEVSLQASPVKIDSELLPETLNVIAVKNGFMIHNVFVESIGDNFNIHYDLELESNLDLKLAHEKATSLELEIIKELGADVKIYTHLEPRNDDALFTEQVSEDLIEKVNKALEGIFLNDSSMLKDFHNLTVRAFEERLIVGFHCIADPDLSLREIHNASDELEVALRKLFPELEKVSIHVEPEDHS